VVADLVDRPRVARLRVHRLLSHPQPRLLPRRRRHLLLHQLRRPRAHRRPEIRRLAVRAAVAVVDAAADRSTRVPRF
jgi:hypothetical protein